MSILSKYLLKNHTSYMLLTLALSVGIYILIDLIERADIFLAYEGGAYYIIPFYVTKLPTILSQILPAVFLLATIILLSLMKSTRESIALEAGGISLAIYVKIFLILGIFWGCAQFVCSQLLMPYGEEVSNRMWREDVRKWNLPEMSLDNVWFTENDFIIHLGNLKESGKGQDFLAYQIREEESEIKAIIQAKNFVAQEGEWLLDDVSLVIPQNYTSKNFSKASLPLKQSARYFFIGKQNTPEQLNFFVLTDAIARLSSSGSNVEALRTIWYGKISYAFSIVVFAFVAIAIASYKDNVYVAVILSVGIAFLCYVLTMLGDSLGRAGTIPPLLAAFGPQFLVLFIASLRIQYALAHRP